MIPRAYITEWSAKVLWQTNEQVEQDLIICRALVEIFSDKFLADRLAFRGGTAASYSRTMAEESGGGQMMVWFITLYDSMIWKNDGD